MYSKHRRVTFAPERLVTCIWITDPRHLKQSYVRYLDTVTIASRPEITLTRAPGCTNTHQSMAERICKAIWLYFSSSFDTLRVLTS